MRHDGDFAAYTAARWPAIVRSLVLLGCAQQEAEGVGRQALARCYLAWGRIRESDDIDVHVYGTVLDCLDRTRRRAGEPSPAASEPVIELVDLTEAARVRYALEGALGRLAPEERTVVVLRFAAGLSELQLSELLDLPMDAVESSLSGAMTGLDLPTVREASR